MKYALLIIAISALNIWALGGSAGKVNIDENGVAIVDDKPFFPLGLLTGGNRPGSKSSIEELDKIADSPFNTIMDYWINEGSIDEIKRYLDSANKRKIKVIYSIKDFYEGTKYYPARIGNYTGEDGIVRGIINEFKHHPAILAWYINDELPTSYISRLTERYKMIKNLDPNHPTWSVLYQVDQLKAYLGTTDIIGSDPYPMPDNSISVVGEWTKQTVKSTGSKNAVWMVLQAHSLPHNTEYHAPTFQQMRCMVYQCLVNGAKGLLFYSFPDLKKHPSGFKSRWSEVKRLGNEIKSLTPVLLSNETAPKVQLSSDGRNIQFTAKRYDGKLYIMAVNVSDKWQEAEFVISDDVSTAKVMFEDRNVSIERFRLKDSFPPIGVYVYEVKLNPES